MPVEQGAAELNMMFGAATAVMRNVQLLGTAHAAILRHLQGYGDADLRQAATRIAAALHELRVGVPPVTGASGALDRRNRADLVTARGTLRRIAGGNEADQRTAASMTDRVLATTCPHDPTEHHTVADVTDGRPQTTCYGCGVTRYAEYPERLVHVTSYAGGEG